MLKKIAEGICVSSGYHCGRAKLLDASYVSDDIEEGSVLIIPNSNPKFAAALMDASAVICEDGGRLSHICIVAMEMGIPCITQVTGICQKVSDGQILHVDATKGEIFIDG